jgi:phosphoserine/homoserine phosphotransferase
VIDRPTSQQCIVTLDLEGVLVPEIWIAVAERTGIAELRRTTRDEPDYDVLMRGRLQLLDQHGLTMSMIADVIGGLAPLDGALEFLDELRARTQVLLLSDTFEQFGRPLMRQLGVPTLLCHRLVVEDDRIVDYALRMTDQKRGAVEALHGLNYRVIAAGDSYNDTAMLAEADVGFLFHAPPNIVEQFPQFPAVDEYDELLELITSQLT